MPTIIKSAEFNFTIENFLDACSPSELKEVDLLIQSNRYRKKMIPERPDILSEQIKMAPKEQFPEGPIRITQKK